MKNFWICFNILFGLVTIYTIQVFFSDHIQYITNKSELFIETTNGFNKGENWLLNCSNNEYNDLRLFLVLNKSTFICSNFYSIMSLKLKKKRNCFFGNCFIYNMRNMLSIGTIYLCPRHKNEYILYIRKNTITKTNGCELKTIIIDMHLSEYLMKQEVNSHRLFKYIHGQFKLGQNIIY